MKPILDYDLDIRSVAIHDLFDVAEIAFCRVSYSLHITDIVPLSSVVQLVLGVKPAIDSIFLDRVPSSYRESSFQCAVFNLCLIPAGAASKEIS